MSAAAHRRAADRSAQQVFVVFGGAEQAGAGRAGMGQAGAGQLWLRPLRRGFRHCFVALRDAGGWTVLDPLTGRLLAVRLDLPAGFDLPAFYRRAGLVVLGPYAPGGPQARRLPPLAPFNCVALCRAVLGSGAPFALTPRGLFQALNRRAQTESPALGKMS